MNNWSPTNSVITWKVLSSGGAPCYSNLTPWTSRRGLVRVSGVTSPPWPMCWFPQKSIGYRMSSRFLSVGVMDRLLPEGIMRTSYYYVCVVATNVQMICSITSNAHTFSHSGASLLAVPVQTPWYNGSSSAQSQYTLITSPAPFQVITPFGVTSSHAMSFLFWGCDSVSPFLAPKFSGYLYQPIFF